MLETAGARDQVLEFLPALVLEDDPFPEGLEADADGLRQSLARAFDTERSGDRGTVLDTALIEG